MSKTPSRRRNWKDHFFQPLWVSPTPPGSPTSSDRSWFVSVFDMLMEKSHFLRFFSSFSSLHHIFGIGVYVLCSFRHPTVRFLTCWSSANQTNLSPSSWSVFIIAVAQCYHHQRWSDEEGGWTWWRYHHRMVMDMIVIWISIKLCTVSFSLAFSCLVIVVGLFAATVASSPFIELRCWSSP